MLVDYLCNSIGPIEDLSRFYVDPMETLLRVSVQHYYSSTPPREAPWPSGTFLCVSAKTLVASGFVPLGHLVGHPTGLRPDILLPVDVVDRKKWPVWKLYGIP